MNIKIRIFLFFLVCSKSLMFVFIMLEDRSSKIEVRSIEVKIVRRIFIEVRRNLSKLVNFLNSGFKIKLYI